MPIDYSKGQIYKVVSNHTHLVYIGSTTQTLSKRMGEHRKHYRRLGSSYTCSAKHLLCYGDAKIILVDNYPCHSKWELERRERHFIESTECVNLRRPAQTARGVYEREKVYEQRSEVRARRANYRAKHPGYSKEWRNRQDKDCLRRYEYHCKSVCGGMCRLYKCI